MDCSECVFAIIDADKNNQTGCKANRLDNLIRLKKAHKKDLEQFYTLTQFCNMYRSEECSVEIARQQAEPLFGIVIHHEESNSLQDVENTVRSILDIDYPSNKVKIIISSPSVKYFQSLMHLVNIVKEKFQHCELILHSHNNVRIRDTECFKKLKEASFFVKIISGKTIESNIFKTIDKLINEYLNQLCMIETEAVTIILKRVMNEIYLKYQNYDLATNYIRKISIEQGKYEKI